ncbi:MAG: metallophosphoesterase family protein [Candidatus Diapherotrites archaeon]|nr:metallophosphoesterase family protein [Candidatus Diapherotrites archaeon]
MRYLVISDVHSNLEALLACFDSAKDSEFKRILCLGDIVGYGANPNECIELLRKKEAICIMGNHDAACTEQLSLEWFNSLAKRCVEWTKKQLTVENYKFLSELPVFFSCKWVFAVHGTPASPIEEYMDERKAKIALEKVAEDLVLCGHTHKPFKVEEKGRLEPIEEDETTIELGNKRMVVSLPSVGQPRDKNPKAGYAILDFEEKTLEIRRVEYEVEKAAKKIKQAGLPEFIAERLKEGR